MKKTVAVILTVSLVFASSSIALAKSEKPGPGNGKGKEEVTLIDKKIVSTTTTTVAASPTPSASPVATSMATGKEKGKKSNSLNKTRSAILTKCDDMIAQLQKLKGYIVSSDGKLLVEFKDTETANAAIKTLDDAMLSISNHKKNVESASSASELKKLSDDLQKNWLKNQVIMKRITGLTSAARLKEAYEKIKTLSDKLGAGINSMTGDGIKLQVEELKKEYAEIQKNLESARNNYLQAVNLYSSITDVKNTDRSFKDAQIKLIEAQKALNTSLTDIKKLLVKLKVEAKARVEQSNQDDGYEQHDNDDSGVDSEQDDD